MTEVRAGASPGEIEQQDEAKNRELGVPPLPEVID
jgi:hypothetical protein